MRAEQIETRLEMTLAEANRLGMVEGGFGRAVIERTRRSAEEKATDAGGWVRTDRVPAKIKIYEAQHPLLGDMVLAEVCWWAEVPDGYVLPA